MSPRGKGTAATSARFYGAIPPAFHQAGTNLMFSPDTAREQQAGVPGASGFHQASISLRLHPAHVRPHPSPSRSCGSSPHPLACCRKKKSHGAVCASHNPPGVSLNDHHKPNCSDHVVPSKPTPVFTKPPTLLPPPGVVMSHAGDEPMHDTLQRFTLAGSGNNTRGAH